MTRWYPAKPTNNASQQPNFKHQCCASVVSWLRGEMPRTHRSGQAPRKCVVALVLEHWKKGQESIILLLSLLPKTGIKMESK